jgi:hypothetical protein
MTPKDRAKTAILQGPLQPGQAAAGKQDEVCFLVSGTEIPKIGQTQDADPASFCLKGRAISSWLLEAGFQNPALVNSPPAPRGQSSRGFGFEQPD